MAIIGVAIVRTQRLFAVVMMSGAFSLLAALLFVTLDAVDVAFTEAAVGAGISTVLMLATIALTSRTEIKPTRSSWLPLFVTVITGLALFYGTLDMPAFGSADAPVHMHVVPEYFLKTQHEVDVPNIVTAILASFRGYDTLGETIVVFTAGIGVVLLISGYGEGRHEDEDEKKSKKRMKS